MDYSEYIMKNKEIIINAKMHDNVSILLEQYIEINTKERVNLEKIIEVLEDPDYIFSNNNELYYEKEYEKETFQVIISQQSNRNRRVKEAKNKSNTEMLFHCVYGKELKEMYDLYSRYYF